MEKDFLTLGLGENARWSEICRAYARLKHVWDPSRYRAGSAMQEKANHKGKELKEAYLRLQACIVDGESDLSDLRIPLKKITQK